MSIPPFTRALILFIQTLALYKSFTYLLTYLLTRTRCLFVKLSMDLLIESCDSSFHINCKTSVFSVLWIKCLLMLKHNSPDVIIKRVNVWRVWWLFSVHLCQWIHCSWWQDCVSLGGLAPSYESIVFRWVSFNWREASGWIAPPSAGVTAVGDSQ